MENDYLVMPSSNGLSIFCTNDEEATRMVNNHYHDVYEIYFFYGDNMTYFIDNGIYNVQTNQIMFIDKYLFHRTNYSESHDTSRIVLLFDDNYLKLFRDNSIIDKIILLFNKTSVILDSNVSEKIKLRFLENIIPQFKTCNPDNAVDIARTEHLVAEVLLNILSEFEKNEQLVTYKTHSYKLSEQRVIDIVKYINENYATQIELSSICSEFFLDKCYLCHMFKKVTGLTLIDFINKKRIVEAEKLLKSGDLSINEVSDRVGFNNANYFIKLFKKKNNITPKSFRLLK